MASTTRVCLVILAAFLGVRSEAVTPIEKVVSLLDKLSAQISAEGKQEAADYDKYACFCKEQADEKLYAIETSTAKIEKLSAKEDMLNKDIAALNDEIADLSKKISGLEGDISKADDKREKEVKIYKAKAKDLSDAVKACEDALDAMKESKDDIAEDGGKTSLAQVAAKSPLVAAALLQQAPAKFQYQSNDIIATLESLLAKFKSNKVELDNDEMATKSAYDLNKQSMSNMKKFAEKDKATKETEVEKMQEDLADTKTDKEEETAAKNADNDFMEVLTSECEIKGQEWDQRSKTRSAELKAIGEASEMLKAKATDNYGANKKLVGLQKVASFLQLRSVAPHRATASLLADGRSMEAKKSAATQKALEMLLQKAEQSASPTLKSLSMKLSLVAQKEAIDHFVKVRGLIKDLLTKLDAQAKDEATQKAFCDTAMTKQIDIRDANKLTIEEKAAALKTQESEKAEVTARIAELQNEIAESKKALFEATELRNKEKEANELSLKMSKEGKEAVDFALTVLKQFYDNALIQKGAKFVPAKSDRSGKTVGDMAPEVFDGEYHGNQDASKGILGILEVIASDFSRTTDQVEKDEEESLATYEKFEKDTNEEIDAKKKEKGLKETRLSDLKDLIIQTTDEKKDAEKALESAEKTLTDLKKQCVDGEETYAERVAKREEEIAALKEAMEILENWKS